MASSHRHGFFLARIIPARSLVSVLPCSCCGLDGNTCASWVVPRLCEEWDVGGWIGQAAGRGHRMVGVDGWAHAHHTNVQHACMDACAGYVQ